ncbi:MAG: phenylalanine--tRNA ligase subunit beta [Alphaproteobacteria bacterium]|nr:phenylalanine--tRNA ligase subunit beta [Alphaproteobacteria bacterium]
MKVTLDWLKDYLDTNASVQEIAEKLTSIGLEIEEVIDEGAPLKEGFVIAQILKVRQHPNADKLHLLDVYDGQKTYSIVCGAPNVREGLKVVFAYENALIPLYNERLKKAVIRGEESAGMCCSYKELGLGEDHSAIIEINDEIPVGTDAPTALKTDVVFDINITPNRGDCLGVLGVARDLAATGIGALKEPKEHKIDGKFPCPVDVSLETKDCLQYTGRVIRGVKNVQSPAWLQRKLLSVGLRPISTLVDITNYFCIAQGRPLHVFDVKKLAGNLHIRSAKDGETLLALDEKEYTLKEGMTVIADDKAVQALGGIMGGELSGCTEETTEVFLESASFEPLNIAKTSRSLNIDSDAKSRFERGVDFCSAEQGLEDATALILEICGGEASSSIVRGEEKLINDYVPLHEDKVKKLTGVDIPFETQKEILKALHFEEKDSAFKAPSYRFDISIEADLVEEILRIYGYEHIPFLTIRPENFDDNIYTDHQKRDLLLRRALASRGLYQAITWSFMDSKVACLFENKKVMIKNPITTELDEMRPTPLANLITAAKRNFDNGEKTVALFEVGPGFYGSSPFEQREIASFIRTGEFTPLSWQGKAQEATVFDIKEDLIDTLFVLGIKEDALQIKTTAPSYYHPGKSASLMQGKKTLAVFGEIHPEVLKKLGLKEKVVAAEIYVDNLPISKKKKKVVACNTSNLQAVERDFAFVLDKEIKADSVLREIKKIDKNLISEVLLFDVYEGSHLPEGKKSLALRVTLQPTEKTLTEAEIDALSQKIITFIETKFKGEIRK